MLFESPNVSGLLKEKFDASAERRKRENADVIRRMRQGDKLCHTDINAYRWAPRPLIKKDQNALKRLYKDKSP